MISKLTPATALTAWPCDVEGDLEVTDAAGAVFAVSLTAGLASALTGSGFQQANVWPGSIDGS